jgi:hypothetical protein
MVKKRNEKRKKIESKEPKMDVNECSVYRSLMYKC